MAAKWVDEEGKAIQLVNEYDILKTDWDEWFFALALFGLEWVINYGGPEIDGYQRWLNENGIEARSTTARITTTPFDFSVENDDVISYRRH